LGVSRGSGEESAQPVQKERYRSREEDVRRKEEGKGDYKHRSSEKSDWIPQGSKEKITDFGIVEDVDSKASVEKE
jgi:hypothetical protein